MHVPSTRRYQAINERKTEEINLDASKNEWELERKKGDLPNKFDKIKSKSISMDGNIIVWTYLREMGEEGHEPEDCQLTEGRWPGEKRGKIFRLFIKILKEIQLVKRFEGAGESQIQGLPNDRGQETGKRKGRNIFYVLLKFSKILVDLRIWGGRGVTNPKAAIWQRTGDWEKKKRERRG